MNLKQILARLAEIREMMQDDEKRGDTSFSKLEEEVKDLLNQKEELEARQRLEELELEDEEREEEEERSNFRKVKTKKEEEKTPEQEEREAFDVYLETRNITTDGLKTDEGYVVVPEEESESIIELADDIVSLKQFVTVKPVSTASGKQPVRTTAKAKLSTVDELKESPAIGVTPFVDVKYEVETKRGYIPYSEEYRQDGINLVPDLKQFMGEVIVNTENHDILEELKTVRGKNVDTVDKLKTLINTGFSPSKKKSGRLKIYATQTVFDNFDRIKDKNGRYLLQESIASSTGYKVLGLDIEVFEDEDFPNKNTMFIGDLKEIVYFDRSQVRAQWTNYLHYGECLSVAIRNDVGKVEDDNTKVNIYKVTVEIPTEPEQDTP